MRKLVALAVVVALTAIAVTVVPAYAATKNVTVGNNFFSPKSLSVKKGTKVTFKWKGGVPHNVTPSSGRGGSKTSRKKGFTYSKTFSKKGTFKYICTIHPGQMKITVKVH
jgi:plastocyanin